MSKILLVEDEIEPRVFYEEALSRRGHIVQCTDASDTAIRYLKDACRNRKAFDLLVLDVVRLKRTPGGPDYDGEGLRLLKIIRKDHELSDLPVIGITIFLDEEEAEPWEKKFRRAGGNEFFRDYPDPVDFADAVSRLCKVKHANR